VDNELAMLEARLIVLAVALFVVCVVLSGAVLVYLLWMGR